MKHILIIFIFCLPACQSLKKTSDTAPALFQKAEKKAKRGYSIEALDTILELKHQFPYSPESALADKLKADIFFEQREWSQAEQAYQNFMNLHPHHKEVPNAHLQQVLSWYHQIPKLPHRDLSLAEPFLKSARDFIKKYPKKADSVKKLKKEVVQKLMQKEMLIARFYFKQKKYQASLERLKSLIQKQPSKEALLLAIKIVKKQKNKKLEEQYLKKLKKMENQKKPPAKSLTALKQV